MFGYSPALYPLKPVPYVFFVFSEQFLPFLFEQEKVFVSLANKCFHGSFKSLLCSIRSDFHSFKAFFFDKTGQYTVPCYVAPRHFRVPSSWKQSFGSLNLRYHLHFGNRLGSPISLKMTDGNLLVPPVLGEVPPNFASGSHGIPNFQDKTQAVYDKLLQDPSWPSWDGWVDCLPEIKTCMDCHCYPSECPDMCGNHISVLLAIISHYNWHEFSNANDIFPYLTALVAHDLLPPQAPLSLPPLTPLVPCPPAALTPLQVGGATAPCPTPAPSPPVDAAAPAPTPTASAADASSGGEAPPSELNERAIALQEAQHAASLKVTAGLFQTALATGDWSKLTTEQLAQAASALTHQITSEGTKRGAPSTLISSLPQAGPKMVKTETEPDVPIEPLDPEAVSLEALQDLCLDWGSFDPAYRNLLKTDPAARKAVYKLYGRTESASFDVDGSFSMEPPSAEVDRSNVPVELRPDAAMSEPTFPVPNNISFSHAESSSGEAYATLLAYHTGDVMPNLNRVYSTLESFFHQHNDVHRQARLRDELTQCQVDTLENALSRRTLIFRKLPPFIQNAGIEQSLDYLFTRIKDVTWDHIQSKVSHLVSATETMLFVTFTTDWACEAVLKYVRTSKSVTKWRTRDAAGNNHDSWVKCEPMVSTWTRLDSQFFSAMCDALGNQPGTPFHGQRLDVNQSMMQVWTPREIAGERRLLGQVSFQILPAAQRYFSVSIWVAEDLLPAFSPRFTTALLGRFRTPLMLSNLTGLPPLWATLESLLQ